MFHAEKNGRQVAVNNGAMFINDWSQNVHLNYHEIAYCFDTAPCLVFFLTNMDSL